MQTTIRTVMTHRAASAHSVSPATAVHDAAQYMVANRLEALLVLEGEKLVGIVTERDCARRVWLPGKDPRKVQVWEIMSTPVVFVTDTHTIGDCMKIMSERGFTHLPVVQSDRVVDVVSVQDLISSMVHDHTRTISHLEGYITGRYPA